MRQARQAKLAERAGGVSGGLAGRQRRRSLITSAAQKLQSSNNIYSRHSLTQRPRFMVHKKKGKVSCIYGPKEIHQRNKYYPSKLQSKQQSER